MVQNQIPTFQKHPLSTFIPPSDKQMAVELPETTVIAPQLQMKQAVPLCFFFPDVTFHYLM